MKWEVLGADGLYRYTTCRRARSLNESLWAKRCDTEEPSSPEWVADTRDKIRHLEANLHEQGVKLFPNTRAGHHADLLWRKIKQHLFRRGAVQITTSALGLSWHREELRRARAVLIEMELIPQRADGLYLLGRYDRIDELVRDSFLDLKAVEEVLVALSGVVSQVKDPDAV